MWYGRLAISISCPQLRSEATAAVLILGRRTPGGVAYPRQVPTAPCPPPLDQATVARMRAQRQRDTSPELALRQALRARGVVGYRLHRRPLASLRRTADLVFPGPKLAVFVQGCWWHGCSEHWRPPTNNAEWWTAKVNGNRHRDTETDQRLVEAGWRSVRIWEHEDVTEAAKRIEMFVRQQHSS